ACKKRSVWTPKGYYAAVSLLTLAATLTVAPFIQAQEQASLNGLYANLDYDKLFDQKRVLHQPEYACALIAEGLLEPKDLVCAEGSLSSANLDAALAEDFSTTKNWFVAYELVEPIFSLGTNSIFFGVVPKWVGMSETGTGFSQFVLSYIVSEKVQYFTKLLCRMYINPESDPLNALEQQYAVKKRHLPASLQSKIEAKFSAARKSSMELDKLSGFLRIALRIPTQSKLLSPSTSTLNALQQQLHGYEPDIYTPIRSALVDHIARYSSKSRPNPSPKTILYFEGKPGLGKTYTVRKMAEALGLPLLEINVASDDMASIIGSANEPGRILESLTQEGAIRNAILFFDEASDELNKQDSTMLSHMKAFIEPSTTHFHSPFLEAKVDVSHVIIILAGNAAIQNEALRTRMQHIEFQSIKPDFKKQVILYEMLPRAAYSEVESMRLNPNDSDLIKMATQLIQEDTDPGFRSIEYRLKAVINGMRLERLLSQPDALKPANS
ncbi:MAG TPA: AAA family ATPase, partial [Opitutales bacterium]|nr:AAA family ATPase [Opitutales bacterium]